MGDTRVAVVAGGTGGIGEGIVKRFIDDRWDVFVPLRTGDAGERLAAYVEDAPSLHVQPADLCDGAAVAAFRDRVLAEAGRIDAVVVSVGAGYFGHSLHRIPRAEWDDSIQDNLATHFNVQRVFVDHFHRESGGVYVTLVGPEAENVLPDGGIVSIMAAAQKMMTRVLAAEAVGSGVRVHTVTAHTTVQTRRHGENSNPVWISAEQLGAYVVRLVNGAIPASGTVMHELADRKAVEAALRR